MHGGSRLRSCPLDSAAATLPGLRRLPRKASRASGTPPREGAHDRLRRCARATPGQPACLVDRLSHSRPRPFHLVDTTERKLVTDATATPRSVVHATLQRAGKAAAQYAVADGPEWIADRPRQEV